MPSDLANERMRATAAVLGALWLAAACASAQAPAATVRPELAAAAAACLGDADPVVRGEAALVAAAAATPAVESRLLALAKDEARDARLRARIALGLSGRAAAVDALGRFLATDARGDDDEVAAAFGLGLAGAAGETAIVRLLVATEHASWKRRRDVVLAMLLGLQQGDGPAATAALRRAFDDDSNRDPEVRAMLLARLVRHDASLDDKALRRVLERGAAAERRAALAALAHAPRPLAGDLLADVARHAAHDPDADARAAALAALTRAGHPPAVDLAARAVRTGAPAEAAQGLRTLRQLGGAGMLRAAAPLLVDERDPARAAALLAAFDAPPPAALRDRCADLAADDGAPWPLRGAAVALLARAEPTRGAPLALDLFRRCRDARALPTLAAALQRDPASTAGLRAALPADADLAREIPRWTALLAAGHGEALALAGKALAGDAAIAPPLPTLRALRAAFVLPAPAHPATPAALRELLADR